VWQTSICSAVNICSIYVQLSSDLKNAESCLPETCSFNQCLIFFLLFGSASELRVLFLLLHCEHLYSLDRGRPSFIGWKKEFRAEEL
jgi:hypothetical protein